MQPETATRPASLADTGSENTETDHLTIALSDDTFALPVDIVQEVVEPPHATIVPNAPFATPGLINVRGNVVPLLDLRIAFGLEPGPDDEATRVVLARMGMNGEEFLVGLKADAVYDVVPIRRAAVESLPQNGTRWPAELIAGVARHRDGYLLVLETKALLETAAA